MTPPEPEFVDLEAYPLVADEAWALQQIYGTNGNGGAPAIHESWIPQNLSELPDTPPTLPTLGTMGIAYPGKRHVFSGPQESAKTLAAYALALEEIRKGETVVLIDFEMGAYDAKTRWREMGATRDELSGLLYVAPDRGVSPAAIGSLIAAKPSCVVLDATAGAFSVEGLDDNSRKDVELWSRAWIDPFRREGIATIALDHVVKNTDNRGAYAIGSERKVGGVDVHIGFQPIEALKRGETGRYRVTTHKDRGGYLRRGKLGELVIVSDELTHALSWTFEPWVEGDAEHGGFRPTVLMERVSLYLEQQGEPVSPRRITEDVTGNAQHLRGAIDVLVSEGWAEAIETANGRRVRSAEPYRGQPAPEVRPGCVLPLDAPPVSRGASVRPTPSGGDAVDAPTKKTDAPRGRTPSETHPEIEF